MGCGTCPKKKPKLNSPPLGISPAMLEKIMGLMDQTIYLKDRMGSTIIGKCMDVWVDAETSTTDEMHGSIAVHSLKGTSLIGFNIIESVESMADHTAKTLTTSSLA